MGALQHRTIAWPAGGVATSLTTGYVAGAVVDHGPANVVRYGLVLSGNSVSSCGAQIEWTDDKTNYYPAEVVNSVRSNVAYLGDGEFRQDSGEVGNHTITAAIPPGTYSRVKLKRIGGTAASFALVNGVYTVE